MSDINYEWLVKRIETAREHLFLAFRSYKPPSYADEILKQLVEDVRQDERRRTLQEAIEAMCPSMCAGKDHDIPATPRKRANGEYHHLGIPCNAGRLHNLREKEATG